MYILWQWHCGLGGVHSQGIKDIFTLGCCSVTFFLTALILLVDGVITNSLVRQAYSSTEQFHTEGLHVRDVVKDVMFGRERISR
jgi:hypothetical protein